MLALCSQHITNNVVQDAVVAVVGEFGRRVDTAPTRDRFLRAVSASQGHRHRSAAEATADC